MNQEFERYMTDDLRIKEIRELAPPAHLIHEFPCTDKASATVQLARNAGHSIIHGKDDRMLHADESRVVGVVLCHPFKKARDAGAEVRIDLCRNTLRIMRNPRKFWHF